MKKHNNRNYDSINKLNSKRQEQINDMFLNITEVEEENQPQEVISQLPSLYIGKKGEYNIMPNSKLTVSIFDNELDKEPGDIKVLEKKGIYLKDCCMVLDEESTQLSRPLEKYDKAVYYAVCSLSFNGIDTFTPAMIYESMTATETNNKQAIKDIEKSIEKMSCIRVSFDWTEHAKLNHVNVDSQKETIVYKENLLNTQVLKVKINGQTTTAYKLLAKPCVLNYEEKVKQLITIKHKALEIKSISNTKDNIVIKHYVIQKIEIMRNPKNKLAHYINLENFYEECNISTNRTIRQRKRKVLLDVLDDQVLNKRIKAYDKKFKGKVLKTIKIIF